MVHETRLCDFEAHECESMDEGEELVAVTDLHDGKFLIARAVTRLDHPDSRSGFMDARVVLSEAKVHVWACGGHARLPLPEGLAAPSAITSPRSPAPSGPAPTAEEAKAAGKRCGAGWSLFNAGELAAAKLEVDAALRVLERAEHKAGQRSLGACLYNRGRIAEQEGDPTSAAELYCRSLAARPNETVEARLASLEDYTGCRP